MNIFFLNILQSQRKSILRIRIVEKLCLSGMVGVRPKNGRYSYHCYWWFSGNLILLNKMCGERRLEKVLGIADEVLVTREKAYRLLQYCEEKKDLKCARRIQELMNHTGLESLSILGDSLIRIFAFHKSLSEANEAFKRIVNPSKYTWAAVISANAKLGQGDRALQLYQKMLLANNIGCDKHIYVAVLKACTNTQSVRQGRNIHQELTNSGFSFDVILGSTLVDMYAKCGCPQDACKVFAEMLNGDVVLWNTMITGWSQYGMGLLVLEFFQKIQDEGISPNEVTYLGVLKGCAAAGGIQGRLIHAHLLTSGLKMSLMSANTLIDMYGKCGLLREARRILQCLSQRDVVSWNAMISGHVQHGEVILAIECLEKMKMEGIQPDVVSWSAIIAGLTHDGEGVRALKYFGEMEHQGIKPNEVTFSSILKACGNVGVIEKGRLLHEMIIKCRCESDSFVRNSLVDMYSKCGSLEEAHRVFCTLTNPNIISFNALIAGYAQHGEGHLVLGYFEQMRNCGIEPDEVSFSSILIACSRAILLEEGRLYFRTMQVCYGITPTFSHLTCIVDLLGRAGCLNEAEDLLHATNQSHIMGWMSLLSACRMYRNIEIGTRCFKEILSLSSLKTARYPLVTNCFDANVCNTRI